MPVSKGQGLRPGAGWGGGTLPCPEVWKVPTLLPGQELAQPRKVLRPHPTGPDKETEAGSLAPEVSGLAGRGEGWAGGPLARVKGTQEPGTGEYLLRFDLLGQHEEKAAELEAVRQGGPSRLGGLLRSCSVRRRGGEFAGEQRRAPEPRPTTKIPGGGRCSFITRNAQMLGFLLAGARQPWEAPSELLAELSQPGEVSQHLECPAAHVDQ